MQKLMLEGKRRKDKTDTSTVATKNVPDDDRQSEVSNDGYDSSLTASDSESEEGKLPDSEEFAVSLRKERNMLKFLALHCMKLQKMFCHSCRIRRRSLLLRLISIFILIICGNFTGEKWTIFEG